MPFVGLNQTHGFANKEIIQQQRWDLSLSFARQFQKRYPGMNASPVEAKLKWGGHHQIDVTSLVRQCQRCLQTCFRSDRQGVETPRFSQLRMFCFAACISKLYSRTLTFGCIDSS